MLEQAPAEPWEEKAGLEQVCWQGLWDHGGSTQEQPAPEGLHPGKKTHTGAVCDELSLWEGLMLEKSVEDCPLRDRPNTGTGEGLLSLRREQQQDKHEMN